MPSVQKKTVQVEVTFQPETTNKPLTLIDRVQRAEPANIDALKKSTTAADQKITLFFKETEVNIASNAMLLGIVNYAKSYPDQSIYIQSYASSGYSGSLKRAINIRGHLIKQEIAPFRINLLAHGNTSGTQSANSIDIAIE